MQLKKEECPPCVLAEVLGVTLQICKKTGDRTACGKIYDELKSKKKPSVADAKKAIKNVKKITNQKNLIATLNDIEKFLDE